MKTLKKTLCLVLAVVMVVGVLILPASAADTTATVEYDKEAAALLQGMGILLGDEDGVSPEKAVTRAQAATFMARLVATPAFMETFSSTSTPFTDCGGVAWALPSIAYCSAQHILQGTDKGFEPDRGVTGHEMAKMLLCAMGYDAEKEGFIGVTFQTNVEILASKTGVSKGIKDLSKPLIRADVITMISNALNAGTVTYDAKTGKAVLDEDETLYTETYDGQVVYGLVISNQATGSDTTDLAVITNPDADILMFTDNPTGYDFETGLVEIGHVMKVYCADVDDIYYAEDVSTLVPVETAITTDADVTAKIGKDMGKGYVINNYTPEFKNAASWTAAGAVGNYVVFNKKIVAVYGTTQYYLDKVTKVDGTKVTISNGAGDPIELDKNYKAYDGIAANDIVAYYVAGGMTYLSKAQKVSGKLEAFDGDSKITINTKTYEKRGTNNSGLKPVTKFDFNTEYVIYVIPDGSNSYFFVATAPEGEKDPEPDEVDVFVVAAYKTTPTGSVDAYGQPTGGTPEYYVQALDMDGNEIKRQISKKTYTDTFKGPDTKDADSVKVNELKSITADKDQKNNPGCYEFGPATGAQAKAKPTLAAGAVRFSETNHYFSNVKFVYVKGILSEIDTDVKTGVQALNGEVDVTYIATLVDATKPQGNSTVSVVFVLGTAEEATPKTTGTTTEYKEVVFALEGTADVTAQAPYTNAKGERVPGYVHTVYIDGVKTEILCDGENAEKALNGFYTITDKVDRCYALKSVTDVETDNVIGGSTGVEVTNMYSGMITLSGNEVVDVVVTGATVINLSKEAKVTANPAELQPGDKVCMVVTKTGTAITGILTIYVIEATRA